MFEWIKQVNKSVSPVRFAVSYREDVVYLMHGLFPGCNGCRGGSCGQQRTGGWFKEPFKPFDLKTERKVFLGGLDNVAI